MMRPTVVSTLLLWNSVPLMQTYSKLYERTTNNFCIIDSMRVSYRMTQLISNFLMPSWRMCILDLISKDPVLYSMRSTLGCITLLRNFLRGVLPDSESPDGKFLGGFIYMSNGLNCWFVTSSSRVRQDRLNWINWKNC